MGSIAGIGLNRDICRDVRVRVIARQIEVINGVVEQAVRLAADQQLGQRARFPCNLGARLFLEPASCELLRGHEVDFAETRLDGGLRFSKPGQPHVCGCGAGEPGSKAKVVFMRPGVGCVKA